MCVCAYTGCVSHFDPASPLACLARAARAPELRNDSDRNDATSGMSICAPRCSPSARSLERLGQRPGRQRVRARRESKSLPTEPSEERMHALACARALWERAGVRGQGEVGGGKAGCGVVGDGG